MPSRCRGRPGAPYWRPARPSGEQTTTGAPRPPMEKPENAVQAIGERLPRGTPEGRDDR